MLSVILPAYNEEKMIQKASARIDQILTAEQIDYELIFVNDGSKDHTWEEIEKAAAQNAHVTGILFSRNFGKESAMLAGLAEAKGDCCAVMDCDLQHPPETLVEMYRLWEQGYEVIEGVKRTRGKESALHRLSAGIFYKMISKAVKIDMSRASDFKLLDRRAVDALLSLPERNVFFRALTSWIGFRTTSVEFDVQERTEGESKWSTWSLVQYAIKNIVIFSTAALQFVTIAGIAVFVVAILLGIQTLVRYFTGHAVEGFTTVILLILIIGSLVMISLGIIGYYIGKIYEEVKGRPRYLISKKITPESQNRTAPVLPPCPPHNQRQTAHTR
ncbi:MAG: glycosyltransferase family 2 protein [Clostridiales bacterium]|nr:glycosyltransferase family 2 protein [Clostridiales bacterium]